MALDEELIDRSNMRDEKADNSGSNASDSSYSEDNSASRAGNLRAAVQESKNGGAAESQGDVRADKKEKSRIKGSDDSEGAADKIATAALSPAKKGIGGLLKAAWENLITSWGLTLFWIDIHVFGNQVMGNKLFCDLGEEWTPDVRIGVNETKGKIEGPKKAVGLIETMGCCCLNLGCLLAILEVLALIALIVGVINNPMEAIKAVVDTFWKFFTRS